MDIIHSPATIIGSGITGLFAALNLAKTTHVTLITKSVLNESSSYYAQGGIAVALNPLDHPEKHIQDTLLAGDGICNEEHVRILVEEGIHRVKELMAVGVQFDSSEGSLSFTKEGAHQEKRILHVKDQTGKAIIQALIKAVSSHPHITVIENTMVIDLDVRDNKCIGAYVLKDGQLVGIQSQQILLATGGSANVYWPNTNPKESTGDGIALAKLYGAELADMEFMQFHPTVYLPKNNKTKPFLISEAARGEGAVIVNEDGEEFMESIHPQKHLAPRNIVAQAIYTEVTRNNKNVFLDMKKVKSIETRFPTITSLCRKESLDPRSDLIPIFPAAHYFMGGIKTNEWGETTIQGLYAAGECASLGLHGGNRLASNSLLEGLVFGYRAGSKMSENQTNFSSQALAHKTIIQTKPESIQSIKNDIQMIMWKKAGIVKNEKDLKEGLSFLYKLEKANPIEKHEIINNESTFLLINAIEMIKASLKRSKSCGSFILHS